MLKVGDLVSAHKGRFKGVITASQGDAEGRTSYRVASFALLPEGRTFSEAELTIEPDPDLLPVGTEATVFGQPGVIDGFDDENGTYSFTALVTLPMTGKVEALHRYPAVRRSDFMRWAI